MPLNFDPQGVAPITAGFGDLASAVVGLMNRRAERSHQEKLRTDARAQALQDQQSHARRAAALLAAQQGAEFIDPTGLSLEEHGDLMSAAAAVRARNATKAAPSFRPVNPVETRLPDPSVTHVDPVTGIRSGLTPSKFADEFERNAAPAVQALAGLHPDDALNRAAQERENRTAAAQALAMLPRVADNRLRELAPVEAEARGQVAQAQEAAGVLAGAGGYEDNSGGWRRVAGWLVPGVDNIDRADYIPPFQPGQPALDAANTKTAEAGKELSKPVGERKQMPAEVDKARGRIMGKAAASAPAPAGEDPRLAALRQHPDGAKLLAAYPGGVPEEILAKAYARLNRAPAR